MYYHDPDRPRSAGGLPQFLHPGWGIVPMWEVRFSVSPAADGTNNVEISVWLLTTPTSASRRSIEVEAGELTKLADAWVNDPEGTVVKLFGYSGPRAAELPGASRAGGAPTLEDLDL